MIRLLGSQMFENALNFVGNYWLRGAEVLIISAFFYYLLISVRGTRTGLVIFGLMTLFVGYLAAKVLGLISLVRIFELVLFVGPIAIIVIFVPEIRRFLERAGRTHGFFSRFLPIPSVSVETKEVPIYDEIVKAVEELAVKFHGAIVAIEKEEISPEIMVPGIWLDAEVSERLLRAIFEPHNPLHDGAVIIRDNRILYASCFFPLSIREDLNPEFGTRHRAGLGITEKVNCIAIIVSEESGAISIAYNGRIARELPPRQFREQLRAVYYENPNFVVPLPRRVV